MLGKLIKYEFKATSRLIVPVMTALISLSIVVRFTEPALADNCTTVGRFFYYLIMSLFSISFAGLLGVAVFAMLNRFKKNVLGTEGYLTMSLPVSEDALVWSKLISASVWGLAVVIVAFFAVVISNEEASLVNMIRNLKLILNQNHSGQWTVFGIEIIIALIISFFYLCLHFYFALSVGNLSENHKGFFATLTFIGIMIAFWAYVVFIIGRLSLRHETMSIPLVGFSIDFFIALPTVLMYLGTTFMMKKHLNLE